MMDTVDSNKMMTTSSAIVKMSNIAEKLKLLNYHESSHFDDNRANRPFQQQSNHVDRYTFCIPANNVALQFNQYVQIFKWLVLLIEKNMNDNMENNSDHRDDEQTSDTSTDGNTTMGVKNNSFENVDEFDDPNIIVQKMMLKLRELQFEIDFPIIKLRQPYGDVVCNVLDFLTDRALQSKGWTIPAELVYSCHYPDSQTVTDSKMNSNNNNENNDLNKNNGDALSGDDEIVESDIDENMSDYSNTDDDENSDSLGLTPSIPSYYTHTNDPSREMIHSDIDPIQWKTELERVGPMLHVEFDDISSSKVDVDWGYEIHSALKQYADMMQQFRSNNCKELLEKFSGDFYSMIERISLTEDMIHEHFAKITNQLSKLHDESTILDTQCSEISVPINMLKSELSNLNKQLQDVKASVDKKGSSMTDTSPLIQLKSTLQQMKAEIRDYDLQIGILEHTLLQKRLLKNHIKKESINDRKFMLSGNQSFDLEE